MTVSGTTSLHVLGQASSVPGAGLSSARPPAFAGRPEPRLPSTSGFGDLNVDVARQDERRIEVIANGLELWGGSQLAVDTTLVSPLTSSGAPRRAAGRTAGAALAFARKAKERTYPEFAVDISCAAEGQGEKACSEGAGSRKGKQG